MNIQKIILNIILNIESFFISWIKIKKNRITFISLESKQLSSDFLLIYNQLNHNQYDIKLCLIHYHKNIWGQFLYLLNCMKQLYYIRTSHIILLHDNNYVVSHYKRPNTKVIQVWHACGAIKKFGNVIERKYPIRHYDYVLATSSYWKASYSQAFGVSENQVLPLGLPRCDELFDSQWIEGSRQYLFEKYPILRHKKIILYAPTFRGNIYNGFYGIDFNAKKILQNLGEDYAIIYKFHPLMGNYRLESDQRIINMNSEDTHQLFCISDYFISDYSSIVFDYMILEKPILFFVPDYQKYCQELGVFVDVRQLGCPVCDSEDDLVEVIQNNDFHIDNIQKNKSVFFELQDGKSSIRVKEFIENIIKE